MFISGSGFKYYKYDKPSNMDTFREYFHSPDRDSLLTRDEDMQ
jgi:antibiotic biosynthesis monooxygenase (ABM) superfamily enzyme